MVARCFCKRQGGAPGEWYLNQNTSTLYFYPPADVDLQTAALEAVRLRHFVEFRGTERNPVKRVTSRGLGFRHTARTFMENKEPLLRSDWTTYRGGAVLFEGAERRTGDHGWGYRFRRRLFELSHL